jgi:long-chain acyl-CoA synthetase
MLSHHNILWNAHSALQLVPAYREDLFLSFLPLSHTLERTAGYYLPMMTGSTIAYNRSIPELGEDLQHIRPTVLMSVPRIFERVHGKIMAGLEAKSPLARWLFRLAVETGWQRFEYRQGRAGWSPRLLLQPLLHRLVGAKVMARLGGRMSRAVVGGAPLPTEVARLFIGLGLPMLQGYGLTETSPVLSVNRLEDNDPASVGVPLPDVELRIGAKDELLARGPGVMLGYWNDTEATAAIIDAEGWLHTGDKARIDQGHVYITGRIKEILVLSNGEKVPPADMEMAICMDSLFEQVMVLGDNRPYLAALVVLNPEQWEPLAREKGLDPQDEHALAHPDIQQFVLERISARLDPFPGYARVYKVHCQTRPWTIDDGLMTPTLKLRRNRVMEVFEQEIDGLYARQDQETAG